MGLCSNYIETYLLLLAIIIPDIKRYACAYRFELFIFYFPTIATINPHLIITIMPMGVTQEISSFM
jgi:hypothetical protein